MGIVLAAIVPGFAVTQLIVNRYRSERQSLAVEWNRRGQSDLPSRPDAAVADFETALSYRDDNGSRFLLAKALVAAGRPAEATAQLQTLAAEDPGNADVNLELARIAAARQDIEAAIRYYHAAIDGVWQSTPLVSRRNARVELSRFLMREGREEQAQAELIALVADLPPDAAQLIDAGRLLAGAGATARALALYRRALSIDASNGTAARLAGELEFRAGDMRAARADLRRAMARGALDDSARELLDVSERVLALDPFVDRLGLSARAQRAKRVLDVAVARVGRCRAAWEADPSTAAPLASIDMRLKAGKFSIQAFERNPDSMDEATALAFDIEKLPSGACGAGTTDDRALSVIGAQHPGQSQ
jgi:tetratricopeptide (TPR) repeat protein